MYQTGLELPVDPGYFIEQDAMFRKSGEAQMAQLLDDLKLQNVSTEVITGEPSSVILSYAEAQNTDLIVLGVTGHRGLVHLLGSTARGVQNKARCEVLTVPFKGAD